MMRTANHFGRFGALAAALGVGNVRRTAAQMTVSIGAAAVVVMATVVPASAASSDEPPPDKTALILCGTTCPTPDAFWVESVKKQFIEPTHPGQDINYVAVTTPEEFWPITGLFRVLGLALGPPELFGLGGPAWPDEPLWKLSGLFDLSADQSLQEGVADLEVAMAEHGNDHLVIYGQSQGTGVANVEKKKLAEQFPKGTPAPEIDFVLGGDPNLPNGGLAARFPGVYIPIVDLTLNGPAATDTQFDTVEINRQFDGFSDFPLYPLNLVADLNAVLGIVYVHMYGFDVSLPAEPTKSPAYQGKYGDTSYYFFENPDLPLFGPLRTLGVPEPLIDVVEPFFRVLVELGYDRSIPPWEPTPARLIPRIDPVKVIIDLVNAVGEGINNALAVVGLPPLLSVPTLRTHAVTPAEDFGTESIPDGISRRLTATVPSEAKQLTSTDDEAESRRVPTETARRTDTSIETEQLGATSGATENGSASTNPDSSTSEMTGTVGAREVSMEQTAAIDSPDTSVADTDTSYRVEPTPRRVTPRSVVRDSLERAMQSRDVPHRRNRAAASTTGETVADLTKTEAKTQQQTEGKSAAASSSAASNSSVRASSGGDSSSSD